ncbi:MAG: hypothetical protein WD317_06285 [Balneolaceae bacterium]
MQIDSHTVEISNRDKIFFPERGISKGDLIRYYDRIADYLLPFIRNRPLTLSRFPDGIEGKGFYQKECPDYFPGWIDTVKVKKKRVAPFGRSSVITKPR